MADIQYGLSLRGHRLDQNLQCLYCYWVHGEAPLDICPGPWGDKPGVHSSLEPWGFELFIPILPSTNSADNRHWRVRNKEKHAVKAAVANHIWAAKVMPLEPLKAVDALFVRHSTSRPDKTNLAWSFKSAEDELCGIIPGAKRGQVAHRSKRVLEDDKPENYLNSGPTVEWVKASRKDSGITLRIISI